MEQSKFASLIKNLEVAYPYYFKDISKENAMAFVKLYYHNLKNYRYEVVAKAISNIIKTEQYMPSLAEVIKECDKETRAYYKDKLNEMYCKGYFKTDEEYGKAVMWLLEDKPLIPQWLIADVDKFIETSTIKQIETEVNENGNDIK